MVTKEFGLVCLSGTVVLWIASAYLLSAVFSRDLGYDKPVFVTWVCTSLSSCLLLIPVSSKLKDSSREGLLIHYSTSASVGFSLMDKVRRFPVWFGGLGALWFGNQLAYNLALTRNPVSICEGLSATNPVFTLALSLAFPLQSGLSQAVGRPSYLKPMLLSTLGTVCGVVMLAYHRRAVHEEHHVLSPSVVGVLLGVMAAFMYATYSVLLKGIAPDDRPDEVVQLFGVVGAVCFVIGGLSVAVAHLSGWEEFEFPSHPVGMLLLVNAVFGSMISDVMLALSVVALNPFFVNVALCSTVPLSFIIDSMMGYEKDSAIGVCGLVLLVYSASTASKTL